MVLASAAILAGYGVWRSGREITKTIERERAIEREVNRRAGSKRLQSESRRGGAVTGWWGVQGRQAILSMI